MVIRIKNLRLRAVIGVLPHERQSRQEVVVNIEMEFDGRKACRSDDLKDAVDYRALKRQVMEQVERSEYYLLEKLTDAILGIVMQDRRILAAKVEVDKPHALRFADSVSVVCSARRSR
jgi:D-erythro-7,8-dihydroneopterin triphosphate epimerase